MQISLLQWNVWYKEDIHNIGEFLGQTKPDIICLQELTKGYSAQTEQNTPAYIAGLLGYNYYECPITVEHQDESWQQVNAVFSRFPITEQTALWINEPTGTGNYDDEYRAYVEVELEVGNQKLTVGTVHMSYTDKFASTDRKEAEADKLVGPISAKHEKYILAGDFNATPNSPTISKLQKYLKNIGPDYSENTWTTKPFSYQGFETNQLDWRLDYIMSTSDLAVISSEAIQTEYSDHLPLLAFFKL